MTSQPLLLRHHRPFVAFWFARIFTASAFQMLTVAIGWNLYQLTGNVMDLGWVGLIEFAPRLLFMLHTGHVADRYDRRRVAAVCQSLQAMIALTLAISSASDHITREMIFILAFLLMLALTGLPLIFSHEIDHLLGDSPELQEMPANTPHLNLQQLVDAAKAHRPNDVMQYFGSDDDEPNAVFAIMAATAGTEPNSSHTFMLDARTGEALEVPSANGGLMMFILRLHVDMFAGLPGKLLLAFMGILFVLAIVSGTVLYLPFMRRHEFATVRTDKSRRLRWLDLHNLLGVVTLTWALVVGVTGVISACADLIIDAWRNDSLTAMIEPYRDAPPLTHLAPARLPVDRPRRHRAGWR